MKTFSALGWMVVLLLAVDSKNPESVISSVPPLTVAIQPLAGKVMPSDRFLRLTAVSLRVLTPGTIGSTNVVFRATDGTNTCEGTFACNATAGNKRLVLSGAGGAGCMFPPDASITYSWAAIGNCTLPPVILGNIDVNGEWQ